jgi:putative hydrolase of HD superfamily
MVLQAKIYEKSSLSKKDISPFLETAKADITHPKLKELFTKIIEDK